MQQSAVPELAHTHTSPIQWVATATAVAGVVALSSVLQPDPATAAQPGPEAKSAAATAAPDPARVDFPIACGPTKAIVEKKASGDLDGDGRPETVAVVHCDAGSGTPPNGIYVLTQAADAQEPRVVATLIDPKDRLNVTDFALRDGAVTATLLGYSSADVPSCCPDVNDRAKWQWKDGAFIRSTPSEARSV
ncbi:MULTISPECIES: hypothetical protein [Streptomyces]|uniref:Secreted protein n=1 Tax=Streptomyces dengpaensis TaxID=2049881 RepID=A0ABM6SXR9_9ACTN|nr:MULTISPECIES: hypothetical protein [Streptomyces]AVH59680.1 hypothetical protein C4B68_32435 [Streptomyces dengpaensis]PIB09324.1 hypothetical protein B1C81_09115 [Streptomyces sp. HG99]